MVQSPSWEANWFAASQEIPRISRNPKVHYRTHKRPPPVSILSQPNPVHIPTSHPLYIHPNIIHPSTPRSPQWSISLRLPHQDPIHPPLLTHRRHMPRLSRSSRFLPPAQYWVRSTTTTTTNNNNNIQCWFTLALSQWWVNVCNREQLRHEWYREVPQKDLKHNTILIYSVY